jgi:monoamine oxidase
MLNPEKTAIKASPKLIDVLIIGGGLSGLMVAHEINRTLPLASWKLLEARSILGGRLANDDGGHRIDMGGAWIWPHHQPHMRRLTSTLNISTFPQPDDPTSTRIDGGAVQYIHVLANGLPQDHIMLGHSVTKCTLTTKSSEQDYCETAATSDEPLIKVETKDEMLMARRVVIAAPPKLVSKHIEFYPPLSIDKQRAMEASQTWMAGVTKVSLVYRRKFWSEDTSNMGLPSHLGPAFQVYDSSTRDGSFLP